MARHPGTSWPPSLLAEAQSTGDLVGLVLSLPEGTGRCWGHWGAGTCRPGAPCLVMREARASHPQDRAGEELCPPPSPLSASLPGHPLKDPGHGPRSLSRWATRPGHSQAWGWPKSLSTKAFGPRALKQ